mmetsp:Transcript_5239/g.4718  ORF Transcript_5239/g.4718 Transcript_5239/m.4718 type:complete len:142 (-) Transcript_5239:42-467(-)
MNKFVNQTIKQSFYKITNKSIYNQNIKYLSVNKTASPYDPPHHHVNDQEAYFGGKPYDSNLEGWEIPTLITTFACVFILFAGPAIFQSGDDLDFKVWARVEASNRLKAKQAGSEIEFGKFYSSKKYVESDEEDEPPAVQED